MSPNVYKTQFQQLLHLRLLGQLLNLKWQRLVELNMLQQFGPKQTLQFLPTE
ncbi:hypothetical protein DPMN_142635 [Dreissena polymorpha]|uniref:Uncharacterized protein n=1 Tax=Dreissena polymorpha TaxID=45954 RepID=A0A9D4JKY4_DREPO|nr:hypothetical protein DPMN_142635 [Dreissena polymorpha]